MSIMYSITASVLEKIITISSIIKLKLLGYLPFTVLLVFGTIEVPAVTPVFQIKGCGSGWRLTAYGSEPSGIKTGSASYL